MKRIGRSLVFALLIGIVLPALISYGIYYGFRNYRGVQISAGGRTHTERSFQDALAYVVRHGVHGPAELKAYLWVPRQDKLFFFVEGVQREVLFDGYRAADLSRTVRSLGVDPVQPGLHYVSIHFANVSPESELEFLWTRNYQVPKEIPPHLLYVKYPNTSLIYATLVARAFGILARLNCLLLFLVPALVALGRRFQGPLKAPGLTLLILLALMLVLRLSGIRYQLEEGIHPDERAVEDIVSSFRTGDLKPKIYYYTPGFHYMTAGFENAMAWILDDELPDHLGPRLLTALFSWLSCLVVLSIGSHLFSRLCAIAACILFGFSFMPVSLSHFGIIEPAMVFFFLLAFRFISVLGKTSESEDFIKAGLASGIAVGVKQTAALILIPFLCAYFFAYRNQAFQKTALKNACLWAGSALIAFLLCAPYTVLDFSNFLRDQLFQFKFVSGHTSPALFFVGKSSGAMRMLENLENGVGYPLIAAALIGCVLIFRTSLKGFIMIVPITVLFFIIASIARSAPYHYALLFSPFLALLAATVVEYLSVRIRFKKSAVVVLIFLLLLPSLERIWRLETIVAGTDTRRAAVEWCYHNVPSGAGVDTDFFGPRFLVPVYIRRVTPIFARGTWSQYRKELPAYYIVDSITSETASNSPRAREWYLRMQQNADKIHEFPGDTQGLYNPHITIYKFRKTM